MRVIGRRRLGHVQDGWVLRMYAPGSPAPASWDDRPVPHYSHTSKRWVRVRNRERVGIRATEAGVRHTGPWGGTVMGDRRTNGKVVNLTGKDVRK